MITMLKWLPVIVALAFCTCGASGFVAVGVQRLRSWHLTTNPAVLHATSSETVTVDPWDARVAAAEQSSVIAFTVAESVAVAEARALIRMHIGAVIRCLVREFDRVYRARFYDGSNGPGRKAALEAIPRLQWRDVKQAATQSAREAQRKRLKHLNSYHVHMVNSAVSDVPTSDVMQIHMALQPGKAWDPAGDAQRLFLKNRFKRVLEEHGVDEGQFLTVSEIHAPDWQLREYIGSPHESDGPPSDNFFGPFSSTPANMEVVPKAVDGEKEAAVTANGESIEDNQFAELSSQLKVMRRRLHEAMPGAEVVKRLEQLKMKIPAALEDSIDEACVVIASTNAIIEADDARKKKAISARNDKQKKLKKYRKVAEGHGKGKAVSKKDNMNNVKQANAKAIEGQSDAPVRIWTPSPKKYTPTDHGWKAESTRNVARS